MDFAVIFRYVVLVIAGAAMITGILVIAGVLLPARIPDDFRVIVGVVIFLYGAYRFTVTFFRKNNARGNDLQ